MATHGLACDGKEGHNALAVREEIGRQQVHEVGHVHRRAVVHRILVDAVRRVALFPRALAELVRGAMSVVALIETHDEQIAHAARTL